LSEISFAPVAYPELTPAGHSVAAEAAGRAAGYVAGRRAAEAELEEMRARFEVESDARRVSAAARVEAAMSLLGSAADGFVSHALPRLGAIDDALLAAAVEIAEAILQHELRDETAAAVGAARRALDAAEPSELRRIRLNPVDLEILRELGELPVEAVADPELDRGDAIADLAHGSVDARLANAVARVRASLSGEAA
jgi:flagellar assembly protein FliH